MVNIRRSYVFLVCLFSLQPVTWALIILFRDLIAARERMQMETVAFQIAIVIIGLPIFLAHWVWAQSAARDLDERASLLRRVYLYASLAAFLAPFIANAYDLLAWALGIPFGKTSNLLVARITPSEAILSDVATLIVLAVLWSYHQFVVVEDARVAPESGMTGAVKRLYILAFSATGLTMMTLAAIDLLRWVLFQFGGAAVGHTDRFLVGDPAALLIVGLPVWLIFWMLAQRAFAGRNDQEHESVLRKVYLYLVVFITVITFVTGVAILVAGLFRSALGLKVTDDIREILPTIILAAIVWAYHASILRGDERVAGEESRQAGIRRLYLYLVAGIGLAAFLIGLGGDISVLITTLFGGGFTGNAIKEQLAWSSAALIAGLLVWILPWRRAQNVAVAPPPPGAEERRSIVRKIYLFFYLFAATMTVLIAAVYIVFRPLSLLLGARFTGNLISDLAHAIAYALIALGVWIYHGWALRGDGELNRRERVERLTALRIAVVNVQKEPFGESVVKELQREFPGLAIDLIDLSPPTEDAPKRLAQAGLIVGSWTIAVASLVSAEIANAVCTSPARKLLVPAELPGWEWVNADQAKPDARVQQTVRAVKQIIEGEHSSSARANVAIIVGVTLLICILLQVIPALLLLIGPRLGD